MNKTTKIAVVGVAGRMGKTILTCIEEEPEASIHGGTEVSGSPNIGKDLGEQAGLARNNIAVTDSLEKALQGADAVIDFSSPESSMETLKMAEKLGVAAVIGTTGFNAEQKKEIAKRAETIACVLAPNMSIGVNVLFKMAGLIAKTLGDAYDVEIVEAHHKFKKDAPSGTAVRLSEILAEALERDLEEVGVYGRKGFAVRGPKEIGIHTVRAGDIVGEHRVMFGGMGETLEISHRAQSRDTFARGSVRAALWTVGRAPGLYDMQDVLGL
ncbi:MAG: 4-hydroxy-tetrahydrodipicolinate reductase [Nitrospinae bacterium CG11_big_fil_rev_8_21_14_0_20_45_15]|nr:MAG: 4-hydroxy-tetrahydrodipicolinate reductase [Nitrospinae bacterium CG11_big_fil_rev_8_21_14_0_20_45_15]